MATESVQTYALGKDNLESISMMLLDAIKAKTELDTVRQNIESAAKHGLTAKQLVVAGMLPRPVDLDITETAEMLQILSMLPAAPTVSLQASPELAGVRAMATETLPEAPRAFTDWDSSMYLAWVRAMSDMMLTGGDSGTMDKHTLSNYGCLMHSLTEAAEELQARDNAAMRKAA